MMSSIAAAGRTHFLRKLRLKRSDDLGREQGQALVRLFVSLSVFPYLIVSHYPLELHQGIPEWLAFSVTFLAFSALVVLLAFRDTRSSFSRRTFTNVADVGAISYLMMATEGVGAPLFVLYLWVTLGNGFRFGLQAMVVSALLSIAGFSAVIFFTPLWRANPAFALGVVLSLILLPVYVSHLIRQITLARKRAEEASAAKGRFLARMSHELRTPLNGINGTADLLLGGKRITREERSLLEVIKDSVAVSLRQIDNVLDFSKIEAGKLILEREQFDLHELVNSTTRMVRFAANDKSLQLMVRLDPTAPYLLIGDSHHLREVLLNLLSNAIKFTEQGYVALEIHVRSWASDRVVLRFEIRDTGIGIAPEALERVFDSFTQEDTSTTRRYGGTGLGTTIAKQLAELMGGRIGVSSVKDRGSVFWCEIPFECRDPNRESSSFPTGARAVLLSRDTGRTEKLTALVQPLAVSLTCVSSHEQAITAIARSIRLGNPVLGVLLDGAELLEGRGAKEVATRALAAQVPLFLLSDERPPEEQLREAGVACVLPHLPAIPLLYNALRASPQNRVEQDTGVVRVAPWTWNNRTTARRRVLIADDNRTNLLILQRMLEQANYEVESVTDGERALERLCAGGFKAAVVDMHMPKMDGTDLIRQYRFLRPKSSLPIVVLTANATMEAKTECAEAGADAYLTKPISAAALLSTIDRLMDDHEVTDLTKRRSQPTSSPPMPEEQQAVLDLDLLSELDRMYADQTALGQVIDAFEADGIALLAKLQESVSANNHPAFCDSLHALKGNAANLGALRLAHACRLAERVSFVEFRQIGHSLLAEVTKHFSEALNELRGVVLPPTGAPARQTEG